MKTRWGYARTVTLPRWDVEGQNRLVEEMEKKGLCLVTANDLPVAGREMCFDRAAPKPRE